MSSIFNTIPYYPPDPLLGLSVEFERDTREDKVDLSVGVYRNEELEVPVMRAVKEAERHLLKEERSKSYQPIDGKKEFLYLAQTLLFGSELENIVSAQALGGTGALYLSGKLLAQAGKTTIYIPKPTWPNHKNIFPECGFKIEEYPYKDGMIETLQSAREESVVLLHGCCHNPTGVDPTKDEWKKLSDVMKERKLVPLFDVAYQGLGEGVEEDAWAVCHFAKEGHEMCVAHSYSKNFGLYGERGGAIFILTREKKTLGALKKSIRSSYSNPPIHSAAIVTHVLKNEELRAMWLDELAKMRRRIHSLRSVFAQALGKKELLLQRGLFSYLDLSQDQVQKLKEKHAIYIGGGGRINISGLTEKNIPQVVAALKEVL